MVSSGDRRGGKNTSNDFAVTKRILPCDFCFFPLRRRPLCSVAEQGEEIRELKKSKPDKATITPYIEALLALKTRYKDETGKDYAPVQTPAPTTKATTKTPAPPAKNQATPTQPKKARFLLLLPVVQQPPSVRAFRPNYFCAFCKVLAVFVWGGRGGDV